MDESSQSERILPERLHRNRKSKDQQPGCALALGIVFTAAAVAGGVILTLVELDAELQGSVWLFYTLIVGGGVFGLLLLWSWFVQKMTAGIPPAVVEISKMPLVSGTGARICVRQPGPVRLKTLRANLICLRRELKRDHASSKSSKTRFEKQVYDQNLIDVHEVRPAAGDEWIERADFDVPADQPLSMVKGDLRIAWRIEVWGRVGFAMAVMHSFDVRLVAGSTRAERLT